MYVRVWRRDGSVFDRPAALVLTDYGLAAEWEWREGESAYEVVKAAQMFGDNGLAMHADRPDGPLLRDEFSPPWAIFAWERSVRAHRWAFRIPVST